MVSGEKQTTIISYSDRTFHAERLEADGVYGETFEADGWPEAEAHCSERGWMLMGQGGYRITDIEQEDADAMIAAMNERDEAGGLPQ